MSPSILEYTLLSATTRTEQVEKLCHDAIQHSAAAVCVPPLFVKKAKQILQTSSVKVATAIGYPLGYSAIEAKLAETLLSIVDGADELNVVINYMAIKNNDWNYIANEINHILPIVKSKGKVLKAVVEGSELTRDELAKCCELYGAAGVDFFDTSTGFYSHQPDLNLLKEIRSKLPATTQLKITIEQLTPSLADELMKAGVTRIGITQP